MYGVVLWSDRAECKAVIWCEDHGDLAYYSHSSESLHEGVTLDAGDLVHFQIKGGSPMRLAQNPELITEQHAPQIADQLRNVFSAASSASNEKELAAEAANSQGNVVSFPKLCSA